MTAAGKDCARSIDKAPDKRGDGEDPYVIRVQWVIDSASRSGLCRSLRRSIFE